MKPLVKPCDVCGKPMELNGRGRRRKRHSGDCTREAARQATAAYNRENRAPAKYRGQTGDRKPYTLAEFAKFCTRLITDHGEPMVLEGFQKTLLRGHFDGIGETVCVIPKGNGKTTLLSALAIFHLMNVPDAEVIIAAASRDQARVLFKQASALVYRSGLATPQLLEVKGGYGEIRYAGDRARIGPRIRVIASDANTADGLIPTLGLVDELHRHRDGDLYAVIRDGLDKREGRMVTISTAGFTLASALGRLRDMAYNLPNFKREGCHNTASSGGFEWHEWCLADDQNRDDLGLVKQANPASFVTPESLKRRRYSPSTTPSEWARFACGIWTAGENMWIDGPTWDGLRTDVGHLAEGEQVYVCVRAATRAGIGIVALRGEKAAVKLQMVEGPNDERVGFWKVEAALRELSERYEVVDLSYDPDQFLRSAELLEEEGLPMTEVPQRAKRLAQATSTIWRYISGGLLSHDGDPELRSQVLGAQTKETIQGWHIDPSPASVGLIAVAMALHAATEAPAPEPMFVLPSGVA